MIIRGGEVDSPTLRPKIGRLDFLWCGLGALNWSVNGESALSALNNISIGVDDINL